MKINAWYLVNKTNWRTTLLKMCVSLVFAGGILWFLLQKIELGDLWHLMRTANFRWVMVGFFLYGITNVFRAYRFGTLLKWEGVKRPLHLIPDMILLSFFNNILPSRAGELSFPILMHRRHQIEVGQSAGLLLIVRIFDLMVVLMLFVLFSLFQFNHIEVVNGRFMLLTSVTIIPIVILLLTLPWIGTQGIQLIRRCANYLAIDQKQSVGKLIKTGNQVVQITQQMQSLKIFTVVLFWSFLGWLSTYLWFASFLNAVGFSTQYPLVVIGATFATVAKAIPFGTIAGFGTHDAGWALGFMLVGVTAVDAITQAFAINILTIFASFIFTSFVVGGWSLCNGKSMDDFS